MSTKSYLGHIAQSGKDISCENAEKFVKFLSGFFSANIDFTGSLMIQF